jgi:hypothetical protein
MREVVCVAEPLPHVPGPHVPTNLDPSLSPLERVIRASVGPQLQGGTWPHTADTRTPVDAESTPAPAAAAAPVPHARPAGGITLSEASAAGATAPGAASAAEDPASSGGSVGSGSSAANGDGGGESHGAQRAPHQQALDGSKAQQEAGQQPGHGAPDSRVEAVEQREAFQQTVEEAGTAAS